MTPVSQPHPIVIAGGTWSGYAPTQEALTKRTSSAYALRLGLSDQERFDLLASHDVSGVFITPQALAELEGSLDSIEPVVIHVFSQTASAAGGEHIISNPAACSHEKWQWALPSRGFEKAIVRRVDPLAIPDRVTQTMNRSASILAVASGEADACVADVIYAKSVVGDSPWHLESRPLPDEIWKDLWTLLVVPRQRLSAELDDLQAAVRQMSTDARNSPVTANAVGYYLSLEESRQLILTGKVIQAYRRWGGSDIAVTADLLA